MKKRKIMISILLIIFTIVTILSFNIVNKKHDALKHDALIQHRELFNNYEGMKYKEYKVIYLGKYEGYIGFFFDEMDKEYFLKNRLYFYTEQFCLYKDGKLINDCDHIIHLELKEKTRSKIYYDLDTLKVKEFILYKNRI